MDRIGSTVSHYSIMRLLGSGGMGDVYLAQDTRLDRPVALKFITPHLARDPEILERFRNEARAAGRLAHENIGRVHDFDKSDGLWFLVLEYVEGETLRERIRRGALPVDDILRIGASLADGLAHAHAQGIVHRDIKSHNVLLTRDGIPKILDFGLARRIDSSLLTAAGTVVGTPAYMSPEQVRGHQADARSDLWSLGVVLHECVTGRLPFRGETPESLLHQIVSEHPEPPSTVQPGMPSDLERVILRCLAKNPRQRYQRAEDLAADLRRIAEGNPLREVVADEVAPTLPIGQISRAGRKGPFAGLGFVAISIALLALASWFLLRGKEERRSETPSNPNWILVADFATNPPDSQLSEAARELTASSLAQSGIVTPLSREQVRRGLELAGKSPDVFLSGDLARELAYRVSIPVYLEGRVDRVASSFSVVLNAMDVEDRQILWSVNAIAADENALIGTLDDLAREMRTKMGEHEEVVRTSQSLREVATASFPAFEHYVQALSSHLDGKYERALRLAREAVALDPAFARAWALIAVIQWNKAELDSCRVAMQEAKSHPERLTDCDRLLLEANWNTLVEWDLETGLAVFEEMAQRCPGREFYSNRGAVLGFLGREEEALAVYEEYRDRGPYARSPLIIQNHFLILLANHKLEEARTLIPEKSGTRWSQTRARMQLALAEGHWEEARKEAMALLVEAGSRTFNADLARGTLFGLDALSGRQGRALDSLAVLSEEEFLRERIPFGRILQQSLRIAQGLTPEFADHSMEYDSSPVSLVLRTVWAAECGRRELADSCLAEVEKLPVGYRRRYSNAIIYARAWLRAHEGDWPGVIEALSSWVVRKPHGTTISHQPIQWILSLANEEMGNLEDAATQLEYLRTGTGCFYWKSWPQRTIYHPYALARLVEIYTRLGRKNDAQARFEELRGIFTDPDPQALDLLKKSERYLRES